MKNNKQIRDRNAYTTIARQHPQQGPHGHEHSKGMFVLHGPMCLGDLHYSFCDLEHDEVSRRCSVDVREYLRASIQHICQGCPEDLQQHGHATLDIKTMGGPRMVHLLMLSCPMQITIRNVEAE